MTLYPIEKKGFSVIILLDLTHLEGEILTMHSEEFAVTFTNNAELCCMQCLSNRFHSNCTDFRHFYEFCGGKNI